MADHVDKSLAQRPNIILLAVGTNDMNPNHGISTEGNDPAGAAERLGKMVDRMISKCPDATILVAMIIPTGDPKQSPRTRQYQQLIPGVVKVRKDKGQHVLAADFTHFDVRMLRDGIHPTNDGYKLMGDMWYDFITQIPKKWIQQPVGPDPVRANMNDDINKNVGLGPNGDRKADYVKTTGEIRFWFNNIPRPWSPAGNNNSIIDSDVGPAKTIYLAGMNGNVFPVFWLSSQILLNVLMLGTARRLHLSEQNRWCDSIPT